MSKPKTRKPWTAMTTKELAAATAEFDRKFAADSAAPLSPADRARWQRARRKRGRPRVGAGAKVVSVTIEKTLLKRVDALAKKAGVSRARLVAAGLARLLDGPTEGKPARRSRAA